MHVSGATDDTKNALRTFLTNSTDFLSNSAARQNESGSMASMVCSSSPRIFEVAATSATRNSVPPVPPSTSLMRPAHDVADAVVRSVPRSDSLASHALPTSHVEATSALQKSPRQSAPSLPAAAVFPTITDIARFSINSTGHSPLAVPLLVAGVPPVDPGTRGRQLVGTLAVTSVPQPSASLSSLVFPAGFVAGSALRLPVAPVQPAISMTVAHPLIHGGGTAERTQGLTSNRDSSGPHGELSDHHDMSSALNWKLKMAREHVSNSECLLCTSVVIFVCENSGNASDMVATEPRLLPVESLILRFSSSIIGDDFE